MFNKVFEEFFKNNYIKGYKFVENYDFISIIKLFQDSGIIIKNVYVNEEADLGLKHFEGNYSLDDFLLKYDKIKNNIESIILDLHNDNRIYLHKNNFISLSSTTDIEISDLVIKSKKL